MSTKASDQPDGSPCIQHCAESSKPLTAWPTISYLIVMIKPTARPRVVSQSITPFSANAKMQFRTRETTSLSALGTWVRFCVNPPPDEEALPGLSEEEVDVWGGIYSMRFSLVTQVWDMFKQWKKDQASQCCTTDVCLHQAVNQLYNNQ